MAPREIVEEKGARERAPLFVPNKLESESSLQLNDASSEAGSGGGELRVVDVGGGAAESEWSQVELVESVEEVYRS